MLAVLASCEMLQGPQGVPGKDGKDGVTPTIEISEDGYWIINGAKTEYKALGTDGKDGVDGANGEDGIDGTNGKDGKDGVTPTIDISADGYWVINGQKSNIKATPDEIAPENPQELEFFLQDDGTYTVSLGNAKYLSNIVIPDTYKGGAVVAVEAKGFYQATSLTSITIGDSVTSIGDLAFGGCKSLETVIIGDSVTSIGERVFESCNLLTSITIPNSVTSIGEYAFAGCDSLTSIIIPNSVTRIGMKTFSSCDSLTSITIGRSVTYIGVNAFCDCSKLRTIQFEGTIEEWNAIRKDSGWDVDVPATEVICSDGTVRI